MEGAAVIGYGPFIREFQSALNLDDEERSLVVGLPEGDLSARELARTIDGVLEVRRAPWGEAAMERIRKKAEMAFSWEEVCQRIVAVDDEVIGRAGTSEAGRR